MTNRDKIMEELADLSAADFYSAMADNDTTVAIENWTCEDCKALYGDGKCVNPEDNGPCRISTEDWLGMDCMHDRLLADRRADG